MKPRYKNLETFGVPRIRTGLPEVEDVNVREPQGIASSSTNKKLLLSKLKLRIPFQLRRKRYEASAEPSSCGFSNAGVHDESEADED